MAFSFLSRRAEIFQAVRLFFLEREYLEVDTPLRLPALLPEANIAPLESSGWYLQTSPELCMKRLLARGHDKIFQICKCFRKDERGTLHLPEFTMLEWYRTDIDYMDLMEECESLLRFVAERVASQSPASLTILADASWEYLSVTKAFDLYGRISLGEALTQGMFDEVLVRDVEPRLGFVRPTFLYDYPAQLGSLARLKSADKNLVERFELYVNGVELANGFSELTDAEEQHSRFVREREIAAGMGHSFGAMPEKFLDDLERIETAAGIALGVDRLVMLLCGAECIDDVVAFTPENL
ncbi:MAG: EF-P lysine aminoacylase GenX [Desulfobulbaceae bacterium]|nr:EF-P lysine aminoacylase GenX [Desulfobulbaceae bacterium]